MYCISCGSQIEQNNIPICKYCALQVISVHLGIKQDSTVGAPSDKATDLAIEFDVLKELKDLNHPYVTPKPINEAESSAVSENEETGSNNQSQTITVVIVLILMLISLIIGIVNSLNSDYV